MKKLLRRSLIAAIGVVSLFALILLGACKREDAAKTAKLTLEVGSGTLTEREFDVEVGASVKDFLADKTPSPQTGLRFAGWYVGANEVGSAVMPESGMTVTAKYFATYTVNLYRETETAGVYSEPETSTGEAIYGEPFTYTPVAPAEGYELDEAHEGTKLQSSALGKEEVFAAYYNLKVYNVVYYANAPAGETAEGAVDPVTVRHGGKVLLPENAFTIAENYRFAGWSTEADGAVEYAVGAEITPTSNLSIYAIWDKALTDRFHGSDLVFFPQTAEDTAILVRTGTEYIGTREGETFSFSENGKVFLRGRRNSDGTFVYLREALQNTVYKHYDAYRGGAAADGATLIFDGYDGATLSQGDTEQRGIITVDPEYMLYSFIYEGTTSGFEFYLHEENVRGEITHYYMTQGAEAGIHTRLFLGYDDGREEVVGYYGSALYLDGFGTAMILDNEALVSEEIVPLAIGSYVPTTGAGLKVTVTDLTSFAESEYEIKLALYNNYNVYFVFEQNFSGEFTGESGKLTLDGYGNVDTSASYTAGGTTVTGTYMLEPSPLGTIVRVVPATGKPLAFRLDTRTKSFTLLGEDYAEYIRFYGYNGQYPLNWPVLVLGDSNTATLYLRDSVVQGTVTDANGRSRFTASDESLTFEFELYAEALTVGGEPRFYHYYVPYVVETADNVIHEKDGTGALILDGEYSAVYRTPDGDEISGDYVFFEGGKELFSFGCYEFSASETAKHFFFRLNEDNTYTLLSGEIGVYTYYDGLYFDDTVRLTLSGEGGDGEALYEYQDEYGTDQRLLGTYTFEDYEGKFTSDRETFSFQILGDEDEALAFAKHTELWEGSKEFTYTDEDGVEHRLELDGYISATYDYNTMGNYSLLGEDLGENIYRIYFQAQTIGGYIETYFDLNLSDGTFELCGYEWGSYNNAADISQIIELDGKGGAQYYIHVYDGTSEDGSMLLEKTGTYEFASREEEVIRVIFDDETIIMHIWASSDGEETTLYYTEAGVESGTYHSAEKELLTLAPFGGAVYTDAFGVTFVGEYSRLTDHAIAFTADNDALVCYFLLKENELCERVTGNFVIDGNILAKYIGGYSEIITIPDGVTEIAPLAFSEPVIGSYYDGAQIIHLDLNQVERIGLDAFNGCILLESVTGTAVTYVGYGAFYACIELATVDLPNVETLDTYAFWRCESLTNIEMNKLTELGVGAFGCCYDLVSVTFDKIETIRSMAFLDCYELNSVVLGASLQKIEDAAFERTPIPDTTSELTVVLKGDDYPEAGENLFGGVELFAIAVKDLDTVKKAYTNDDWKAYADAIGVDKDGADMYYRIDYQSLAAMSFGVVARIYADGAWANRGMYEFEGAKGYLYKADDEGFVKQERFHLGENGALIYDVSGYASWGGDWWDYYEGSSYYKAGTQLEYTLSGLASGSISFSFPVSDLVPVNGVALSAPAVWHEDGADRDVTLEYSANSYGTLVLTIVDGGYRVSFYFSSYSNTFEIEGRTFIPIVTEYTHEDGSKLYLSQEDEDGEVFTVTFTLNAFEDEYGNPLVVGSGLPVEVSGNTYTPADPVLFAGYRYTFAFVANPATHTFTYRYESQKRTVARTEDGKFTVIVYQNPDNSLAEVFAGFNEEDTVESKTDNFELIHEEDSLNYEWYIYDYSYAGHYTLTLSFEADGSVKCDLKAGKVLYVGNGGVYVEAFVTDAGELDRLYIGTYYEYEQVENPTLVEGEDYYLVEFEESEYYVTVDIEGGRVTFSVAEAVYEGEVYGDALDGTVRIVYNPDGSIKSMELNTEGGTFTEYLIASESGYYFPQDGFSYYVRITSYDCSIFKNENATYTSEDETVVLEAALDNSGYAGAVISLTVDGEEAQGTLTGKYDSIVLIIDGETKRYFALDSYEYSMEEVFPQTISTSDGKYTMTYLCGVADWDGETIVYTVLAFEYIDYTGQKVLGKVDYAYLDPVWTNQGEIDIDPYPTEESDTTYANIYFTLEADEDGTITVFEFKSIDIYGD